MDAWLQTWLEQKYGGVAPDSSRVRIEDCGALPFTGEVAVWHPLDDLYEAPRIPFGPAPHVQAVWVGDELAGYLLRASGTIASWRDLGDASTDTDRFFLVQVDQTERVIDWLNEDPGAFEELGGHRCVETVEHDNGTRIVVIQSPDGGARVRAAHTDLGELACAIIDL